MTRGRVATRVPVFVSEPPFTGEGPSSSPSVLRYQVSSSLWQAINLSVGLWTGAVSNVSESGRGLIHTQSGSLVLADVAFQIEVFELGSVVSAWPWAFSEAKMLRNSINSPRPHWKWRRCHFGRLLIVVLHQYLGTLDGPGCLWIWGIRYDWSGDCYRLSPKDNPLLLVNS